MKYNDEQMFIDCRILCYDVNAEFGAVMACESIRSCVQVFDNINLNMQF